MNQVVSRFVDHHDSSIPAYEVKSPAAADTISATLHAVRDDMDEPPKRRARMKTMKTENGSSYRVEAEQLEPIQCPADMAWLRDVLKVIPAAAPPALCTR